MLSTVSVIHGSESVHIFVGTTKDPQPWTGRYHSHPALKSHALSSLQLNVQCFSHPQLIFIHSLQNICRHFSIYLNVYNVPLVHSQMEGVRILGRLRTHSHGLLSITHTWLTEFVQLLQSLLYSFKHSSHPAFGKVYICLLGQLRTHVQP